MSELGRHLYCLMRGGPYESSTTLEDYSCTLPSGALVYKPLRARAYRMILKSVKGRDLSSVYSLELKIQNLPYLLQVYVENLFTSVNLVYSFSSKCLTLK